MKSISMAEALSILESMDINKEKKKEIETYLKKFIKINKEKAQKMREEIEKLEIIKIKPHHISQIINIMPENASELNKIFTDTTLNEDETNRILEIVRKYK